MAPEAISLVFSKECTKASFLSDDKDVFCCYGEFAIKTVFEGIGEKLAKAILHGFIRGVAETVLRSFGKGVAETILFSIEEKVPIDAFFSFDERVIEAILCIGEGVAKAIFQVFGKNLFWCFSEFTVEAIHKRLSKAILCSFSKGVAEVVLCYFGEGVAEGIF